MYGNKTITTITYTSFFIYIIDYCICLTFVLYCIAVMRIVGEATVLASVIVIFWQKLLLPWSFLSEYRQKKDRVGLQIRNSSQPVSDCWFSRDKLSKLSSNQHIGSNILVKYELSRSQSKAMIKSASTERLRFHTNLISSLQLAFSRIARARKPPRLWEDDLKPHS